MDGFRLEPTQYDLVFEDPKLNGLRVSMGDMSLQQIMDFDAVRFTPVTTIEGSNKRTRALAETIAAHVVDWNLIEKDGSPTPRTAEGLLSHDQKIQLAIVPAYAMALRGVPDELGKESTNGAPEDSIPMETLPPNL